MEESIFAKIVNGTIPSYRIYEDEKTLAFLDIHPINEGQVLVIPKIQVEYLWDLSQPDYDAVMATVKKVAKRLKEVLGTKYVGVQVEGVDVPHAHVKVIPFNTVAEFHNLPDHSIEPDNKALSALANKLQFDVQ